METGQIFCGNAKEVLLNSFCTESIDLIYVDPPFFSNRNYEVIWGNGFELKAYEDRWQGGIENYIAWMEPILIHCHRVLKSTGSMYLHCDWHANAHLRILMDRIFGKDNFLNEIIWWYHDPAGTVKNRFKKKHDTILFYAKSSTKERTFNMDAVRQPYSEGTQQQAAHRVISFGRPTKTHPNGKVPEDVWEIPFINSQAKERLGYPTQKPELLLERIVLASSNHEDMVLDPMCGGGTTLAVAQRLHRKWAGIDVSPLACKMSEKRLRKLGAVPRLIGMPMSIKALKALQPFAFQQWVIEKLYAHPSRRKVGDMGIDGFYFDGSPIQVKQSDGVGRNVIDNFETAVRRLRKATGTIVAFSFGRGAHEEVARARNKEGLDITLLTVRELLDRMGAHDDDIEAVEWSANNDEVKRD